MTSSEAMIEGLNKVSWERIDVSFSGSKQRFFAHSTIQASTWLNLPLLINASLQRITQYLFSFFFFLDLSCISGFAYFSSLVLLWFFHFECKKNGMLLVSVTYPFSWFSGENSIYSFRWSWRNTTYDWQVSFISLQVLATEIFNYS